MKPTAHPQQQAGNIGWLLLWLFGVPLPLIALLLFLRGWASPRKMKGL